MPKIIINEIDNTIYQGRELANNNIVLIPGTAITGPSDPTLVSSAQDFRRIFGSKSPNPDSSVATAWDYANSILSAGMPVLFQRITGSIDGSEEYTKNASAEIEVSDSNPSISSDASVVYRPAHEETEGEDDNIVTTQFPAELEIGYTLIEASTVSIVISSESGRVFEWESDGELPAESHRLIATMETEDPGSGSWINPELFVEGSYTIEITATTSENSFKLSGTFDFDGTEISNESYSIDSKVVAKIKARYGGTFGNELSYEINVNDSSAYIRVKSSSGAVLENKRIAVFSGETQEERDELMLKGMKMIMNSLTYVEIYDIVEEGFSIPSSVDGTLSGGEDADEDLVKTQIPLIFDEYRDKLIYDIKFITSGGYTDDENSKAISSAMIALAEARGDCLAIVDIELGLPDDQVVNFFDSGSTNSSYATAYAPWCKAKLYDKSEKWCAPSYMFLSSLAKSVNSGNPIYLAPAGVKRAQLTNVIETEYPIGSAVLDAWQSTSPTSINPIMNIYNYGYVIYGQRTLYSTVEDDYTGAKTSALQELSVRLVSNEIKKLIFSTALYLTFDQNNLYTWNEFKSLIVPALDDIRSNGGINDYLVEMDENTITDDDINTGTIRGSVTISVTRTAENFTIDFVLEPSSVTFDEENDFVL